MVELTEEKKISLFQNCKDLLEFPVRSIRHIARVYFWPHQVCFKWWCNNIPTSYNEITKCSVIIAVRIDTCKTAWCAICNQSKTGSCRSQSEQNRHINSLELLPAKFGLKTFVKKQNLHVKVLSDHTTTVHGINGMSSSKSESWTKVIW